MIGHEKRVNPGKDRTGSTPGSDMEEANEQVLLERADRSAAREQLVPCATPASQRRHAAVAGSGKV
jgi:hypothetical protein